MGRSMKVTRRLLLVALSVVPVSAACVYHEPAPVVVPSKYDRSFDAALGAASDVGVAVRSADRNTGRILGTKAGTEVTIELKRQPNGTVQVEFSPRTPAADPSLGDQWLAAYQRRMGR